MRVRLNGQERSVNIANVLMLLIVILNSGGIKLVPSWSLTLFVLSVSLFSSSVLFSSFLRLPFIFLFSISFLWFVFSYLLTIQGDVKYYIVYLTQLISAIFVLGVYHKRRFFFLNDLYVVLLFLMVHGAIAWIAQFFLGANLEVRSYGGIELRTFSNIFFYPLRDSIDVIYRNVGLFWEPGIFQIYMNILLFMALFIFKDIKVAAFSSFIVFTTFSTSGLVVLVFQMAFFLFLNFRKKVTIFILLAGFLFAPLVFVNFLDKLVGAGSGSYNARVYDFVTGVNIIKDFPFHGIGVYPERYIDNQSDYSYESTLLSEKETEERGNTNGFITIAIFFGLPVLVLYIVGLLSQNLVPNRKPLFGLMMLLFLLVEPLSMTTFFFVFVLSGWLRVFDGVCRKHPKIEKPANKSPA